MIDLQILSDKLLSCIGLLNALNYMAWRVEGVDSEFQETFNSVLSLGEFLETGLKDLHKTIQAEV